MKGNPYKNSNYEKYTCVCGCILNRGSRSVHIKTKKHIKIMTEKKIEFEKSQIVNNKITPETNI